MCHRQRMSAGVSEWGPAKQGLSLARLRGLDRTITRALKGGGGGKGSRSGGGAEDELDPIVVVCIVVGCVLFVALIAFLFITRKTWMKKVYPESQEKSETKSKLSKSEANKRKSTIFAVFRRFSRQNSAEIRRDDSGDGPKPMLQKSATRGLEKIAEDREAKRQAREAAALSEIRQHAETILYEPDAFATNEDDYQAPSKMKGQADMNEVSKRKGMFAAAFKQHLENPKGKADRHLQLQNQRHDSKDTPSPRDKKPLKRARTVRERDDAILKRKGSFANEIGKDQDLRTTAKADEDEDGMPDASPRPGDQKNGKAQKKVVGGIEAMLNKNKSKIDQQKKAKEEFEKAEAEKMKNWTVAAKAKAKKEAKMREKAGYGRQGVDS